MTGTIARPKNVTNSRRRRLVEEDVDLGAPAPVTVAEETLPTAAPAEEPVVESAEPVVEEIVDLAPTDPEPHRVAEPDESEADESEPDETPTVRIPAAVVPAAPAPAPPAEPAAEPVAAGTVAPRPTIEPGRIRRAPALDGLRGIAVLSVVVYHLFGDALRGGYLGVDIFFVLSGFLITSLLVREFGSGGRVSLDGFWTRRARRIIPASVTVLVVATAVAGLIGGDVAVKLKDQFFGSLFFVNNWVQIAQSDSYFAETTPRVFMHYWSLAIEEQFYVVWPLAFLAVMALTRRSEPRRRMLVAAGVATVVGLASAGLMAYLYHPDTDPSRVYFGSDTHLFGLLAGVALALVITAPASDAADSWPLRRSPAVARWVGLTLAPIAFVALMAMLYLLPDTSATAYRGGILVACLLTTLLVHNAVREDGPIPKLLSVRALTWFGARSFSLYLWHWPAFIVARELINGSGNAATHTAPAWMVGVVAAVASLVLSELSYRWIETPFRRLGFRGVLSALGGHARRFAPLAAMAAVLTVVMLAGSALGTSPSKSALERQLDELAEIQRQANEAPAVVLPPKPSRDLPTGPEITAIGDSVMLASSQALTRRFPGIYIDAEVSRHYSGGEGVMTSLLDANKMREFVVLGFGTNGQAFPGELNRIVRMLGPDRKVVLLVPYGPVAGIPEAARQVIRYAKRKPNVFLAPWCSIADAHQDDLGADGVHPFGPGLNLYADAVEQGLRQAVSGTKDTGITCPL
ncbi:acyltransferase [Gordonia spumicola]|uniref:Acyltransferase n=1 Tax=Gordonia spumicola TaxID=589161 RepID=A0A7I9V5N5_9ACTN|nr:acyltransferase family protein [Gordonia spumicola]GEE00341.1 acyltransferase [Gordonia spumicola]